MDNFCGIRFEEQRWQWLLEPRLRLEHHVDNAQTGKQTKSGSTLKGGNMRKCTTWLHILQWHTLCLHRLANFCTKQPLLISSRNNPVVSFSLCSTILVPNLPIEYKSDSHM